MGDDIIAHGPPGRGGPRGPKGVDFLVEKVKKDHAAFKQADLTASKLADDSADPNEEEEDDFIAHGPPGRGGPRGPKGVDFLVEKVKEDHAALKQADLTASKLVDDSADSNEEEDD